MGQMTRRFKTETSSSCLPIATSEDNPVSNVIPFALIGTFKCKTLSWHEEHSQQRRPAAGSDLIIECIRQHDQHDMEGKFPQVRCKWKKVVLQLTQGIETVPESVNEFC